MGRSGAVPLRPTGSARCCGQQRASKMLALRGFAASVGGIGRRCGVEVEEPGVGLVAGGVTVAVGVIGGGAAGGELFAAGRLRELPNGGVGDAAGGGWRGILWNDASGRGRAGVVEDPIGQLARADVFANVVGSDDG